MASWLSVQAAQTAILLILSVAYLLVSSIFLVSVVLLAILIYVLTRSIRLPFWPEKIGCRDRWLLAAIAIPLLVMWVRAMFLYDFTWDAQTYGFPRLAMWLNYGSVFVHMPTPQLNLFVNEWNGELNSLAYALASNSYLGFAFGNVEVLVALVVTLIWIARLLDAPKFWALSLAAMLSSAPALLGLASTVKGDLLACVSFLMTVGWLIHIKRGKTSPLALGMLVLSASLSVGSKISVVVPLLVILAFAIPLIKADDLRKIARLPLSIKLALIAGVGMFSSRFWINWVVYANPVKRIDGEQASFSVHHMVTNLALAGERIFNFWDDVRTGEQFWALSANMGTAAWAILIVIFLTVVTVRRRKTGRDTRQPTKTSAPSTLSFENTLFRGNGAQIHLAWLFALCIALFVSTAAIMTLTEAHPWSFRYFAPGLIGLLLAIGAVALRGEISLRQANLIAAISVLVVASNLAITLRQGEIMPTRHLTALVDIVKDTNTPLKRMSLLVPGPFQDASVDALALDSDTPLHILALNAVDCSMLPFLGSHAQNRIQTVADSAQLTNISAHGDWDVIAVIQKAAQRDPSLLQVLERQGYWVAVDNDEYLIAVPKTSATLTPVIDLSQLQWTSWNADSGAKLNVLNHVPEIGSSKPIDAGFYSQELTLRGPLVVIAAFDGDLVDAVGSHAAHISLFGKQPVLLLPPGRYTSGKEFQAVIPRVEPNGRSRLAFGLGGWALGSGQLRLTKLDVFKLRVKAGADTPEDAITPDARSSGSAVTAIFASGIIFLACALLGRLLLSAVGITIFSPLGGGFVFGYGIFGLSLLLALRYINSPLIGAFFCLILFIGMAIRKAAQTEFSFKSKQIKTNLDSHATESRSSKTLDYLIFLTIASWVVAIALTYIPMIWLTYDPKFELPEIFDLPKHFFSLTSLYGATSWPISNPFFQGKTFSYNFLYYYPPAFISTLLKNPLSNFSTFPISVIAVSLALPVTIFEITKSITQSKLAQFGAVLLATWVGGLTPLWVSGKPGVGVFLYTEKLLTNIIWVDELFVSAIFVPQHIFAVLCGIVGMSLLARTRLSPDYCRRIFFAEIIIVIGALSSLILLPLLAMSYAIGFLILVYLQWRIDGMKVLRNLIHPKVLVTVLLPLAIFLPFLIDAIRWSGGEGSLIALPNLSKQWFYVASAIGFALPLAVLGSLKLLHRKDSDNGNVSQEKLTLGYVLIMIGVGLIGMLFGGYSDAGIKSGLWLRICLVPLASAGFIYIGNKIPNKNQLKLTVAAFAILFAGVAALNFPTTRYFIKSALLPIDPGIKAFIQAVREIPANKHIALLSNEQNLVALTGRQIDFDFSAIRSDSYMPPSDREIVKNFWNRLAQNDAATWQEVRSRYFVLIAPTGSAADLRLRSRFTTSYSVAGYTFYRTAEMK